ncbi:EmrB/QacA family drug resistance transporter, partial [Variovorax sp. Varisp62]
MAHAKIQALGQLAQQIQVQSTVITYSETFWVLGVALLACIPLAFLLKKPRPGASASVAGH